MATAIPATHLIAMPKCPIILKAALVSRMIWRISLVSLEFWVMALLFSLMVF
jgi:hypothetical protein